MREYKCYLFDVDNTLIRKTPHIIDSVYYYLNMQESFAIEKRDVIDAYAKSELWIGAQIIDEMKNNYRMTDDEFKSRVLDIYMKHLMLDESAASILRYILFDNKSFKYELNKNVKCVLNVLKERGSLLGIVSNNTSSARTIISEIGLLDYFDIITLSEEVGLYKPDPDIILYTINRIKVKLKDVLYIGDHPYDILCARLAGVDVAWYQPNRIFSEIPNNIDNPDYMIYDMIDVIGGRISHNISDQSFC